MFGSSKRRRAKSVAAQLRKVNNQIKKEEMKVELAKARTTLSNLRLTGKKKG